LGLEPAHLLVQRLLETGRREDRQISTTRNRQACERQAGHKGDSQQQAPHRFSILSVNRTGNIPWDITLGNLVRRVALVWLKDTRPGPRHVKRLQSVELRVLDK